MDLKLFKLFTDNPQIRDNLYDSLDRARKQSKVRRPLTFITGDFNSYVPAFFTRDVSVAAESGPYGT